MGAGHCFPKEQSLHSSLESAANQSCVHARSPVSNLKMAAQIRLCHTGPVPHRAVGGQHEAAQLLAIGAQKITGTTLRWLTAELITGVPHTMKEDRRLRMRATQPSTLSSQSLTPASGRCR